MFHAQHYINTLVPHHHVNFNSPLSFIAFEHTYATRLLEKDVQLVDIQALLGHESIATTQIYTHAGQERLSKLVADI